jgi:hypothetical protein
MAQNFNFNGAGPYTIVERETDVLVTDTSTGIVSPIGKGVCKVEYVINDALAPQSARPVRQGSDLGPISFPRLGLIAVGGFLDKDGNPLPFATIVQYASSLGIVLNNGTGGGGTGGTTLVPNLYLQDGVNASVTTDVVGSTYVSLASAACRVVSILNTAVAAVDIEVAYGAATAGVIVPAGGFYNFPVTSDANALKVRRADLSNTPVVVQYMIFNPSTT